MRAQDPLIFKMRAPSFLPPSVLKVGLNFLACHFILLNTLVDLHPCNLSQKIGHRVRLGQTNVLFLNAPALSVPWRLEK